MSNLILNDSAAPSTPASGKAALYVSTSKLLRIVDSNGNDSSLHNNIKYNYLRNGGFWFAQRQAPGSTVTYNSSSARAFTADGWAITNENASMTYLRTDARSTPESGLHSPYYGSFVKSTSTGKLTISQCIESNDVIQLRGRTVRVTLDLKRIVADSNVRIGLMQLTSSGTVDTIPATFVSAYNGSSVDPTWGTNLALIAPKTGRTPLNCTVSGSAVTAAITSTWKTVSFVVDVPSNCRNLLVVVWTDAGIASTNGIAVGGASLTEGEDLQDWQSQDIGTELARCQRFYSKSFDVDDNPVAAGGVGNGEFSSIVVKAGATALAFMGHVRYPVVMFKVPTVATFNPTTASNTNPRRYTGAAAADLTAVATANISTRSFELTATGEASGTVGDRASVHWTADGEL